MIEWTPMVRRMVVYLGFEMLAAIVLINLKILSQFSGNELNPVFATLWLLFVVAMVGLMAVEMVGMALKQLNIGKWGAS